MADTAIQMLLKRLRGEGVPIPYAPIPDLGPLSTDTSAAFQALNREPVPPQFAQPAAPDMNFVNQYAGPAPTAPIQRDPSTLAKIAAVLSGIGAGPEYGMALREEMRRPMREYEAKRERFEERRTRGLELAERRAEREADRAQRAAELSYEREREVWLKKTGIRNDEAKEVARRAFDIQKIREQERIADERLEQQQRAAKEKQRNDIYAKLISQDFAPQKFASEMADNIVFNKPLSAAAEKWRSVKARKLEAQLANIGGGAGGGPVMAKLANGQLVPLEAVNKDVGGVMLGGEIVPVVEYVGGRIPRQPQQPQAQAAPPLNLFPEFSGGLLTGGGGKTIKMEAVRRQAKKAGISPTKAAQDFKDAGYTIQP